MTRDQQHHAEKALYGNPPPPSFHEFEVHKFSAEASTLGFPVGQWPTRIETDLGNGMPFIVTHSEVRGCDLLWVTYSQANGCITLRIYND